MLDLAGVVDALFDRMPHAYAVSTCGYPSRELFHAADRPRNFYLVGSMGMAAPVALGLALARAPQSVIAIDGDGSVLMNLGALPMIAASRLPIIHVIIDNGVHESTGGQKTAGRTSNFVDLALAAGYQKALRAETRRALIEMEIPKGPTLIHVPTERRIEPIPGRVGLTPQELVQRIRVNDESESENV